MTDKQIIIDDLDTRCPYHCNERIGQCNNSSQETPHTYCIGNKDCIYKLYARKEQECEYWKHQAELGVDTTDRLTKELEEKEQECEQLKAELELFKTSNQTTIDQLKAENETLFKAIEEVNKINKRLEAEKEELKEQLEKYKDNEQEEKEMQELYNKFNGSSLIEKRSPYGN